MAVPESISIAMLMVIGGVGLFLFGMELLVTSLQRLTGPRSRVLIRRLGDTRLGGLLAGTSVATLIHSGPTSLIVLGFVNAGFLTFLASIPLILGANLGTTVAMQIVAFDVGRLCFAFIGVGFLVRLFARADALRQISLLFIGFGILFLGLMVMKEAMGALRDNEGFLGFLGTLDPNTWSGFLLSILTGLVLTAIFQSSGGTLSLLFSLAALGLIDGIGSFIPILIGTNLGKCSPTVIAAIHGNAAARRVACSHVLFNALVGVAAILFFSIYTTYIPYLSDNLVRQIAHLNTAMILVGVLFVLPVTPLFAKVVELFIPTSESEKDQMSHLDPSLVPMPEKAILVTVKELQRQALIVDAMLKHALDGLASLDMKKFDRVRDQENSVDIIKHEVEAYLNAISERGLSTRQGLMLQRLFRVAVALERTADHIEMLGDLLRFKLKRNIWFDDDSMRQLLELGHIVRGMMAMTMSSLDPLVPERQARARQVIMQRKQFKKLSRDLRDCSNSRLAVDGSEATTALFFIRFLSTFDRIVHHLREVAQEEKAKTYLIKSWKLDRVAPHAARTGMPSGYELSDSYEEALVKLGARVKSHEAETSSTQIPS